MKKAIETLQDLIDEAKIRTVGWALCIFAISYFLSHTSKSMWTNIPISILLLSAFRILSHEVEFRWKVHPVHRRTYLSHLEKKQLSLEDPRLSNPRPSSKWKRKIESPVVEAAIEEFINKILQDFVVDLWYSEITPDREAPEQMRLLINDVLGEISGRVKEINLVDLLTRKMVDLIRNHLDLYRRNQSAIGVEVMGTLSFEERDERLKHHLIASKELHPALFSPECEYKVLQRLMGGVLAVVLKPRDAQCPLVRSIGRELLTCLVMQPIMNFACPGYINELIEYLFLNAKDDKGDDQSAGASSQCQDHTEPNLRKSGATSNTRDDLTLAKIGNDRETSLSTSGHGHSHVIREDSVQPRPADWARVLEAATQRRSEVLAPENLENMWARGRNYKSKLDNHVKAGKKPISVKKSPEMLTNSPGTGNHVGKEGKVIVQVTHGVSCDTQLSDEFDFESQSQKQSKGLSLEGASFTDKLADHAIRPAYGSKTQLKRSNSTSALKIQPDIEKTITGQGRVAVFSEEFDPPNFVRHKEEEIVRTVCDTVFRGDGILHIPKVKCRVVGAYFEKTGSKSFAVYSIAVTDVENKTWFVKRRYRNFERLHRHLKDIPNYALHLPPKRFLSSSVDDNFVHQRCIQLDQYLQDLLSIANVAEQHEVWDFLSASSKNYSFGKSTSVMKSLAVNVDDAMDDILRQFKGVSGGLMRKVTGSPSLPCAPTSISGKNLSWNGDEMNKSCNDMETSRSYHDMETSHSLSDNEEHYLDGDHGNEEVVSGVQVNGWHSDNELNSKSFPPRVIKRDQQSRDLSSEQNRNSEAIYGRMGSDGATELVEDPIGMLPELEPPNVSVPLLNLVENIFQLNRRGWLRRQVIWISKQILQLMMEDAIDDWIVRQIHWLRRDDIIALGIRWVQDVLWPNGTFFLKLESSQGNMDETQFDQRSMQTAGHSTGNRASKLGSLFELQREAARRASDVEKMILGGAPTTLVSLIGNKQYKRCAKDIYYFLQSNICVKQLAYGMLELLLVSIFPELQDLVLNMHEERRAQQA